MVDSYCEQEFQVLDNGDRGYLLESLITQRRAFSSEKCQNFQKFIISSHSSFETLEIGFYGPQRWTRFVIRDETTLVEAILGNPGATSRDDAIFSSESLL